MAKLFYILKEFHEDQNISYYFMIFKFTLEYYFEKLYSLHYRSLSINLIVAQTVLLRKAEAEFRRYRKMTIVNVSDVFSNPISPGLFSHNGSNGNQ